MSFLSQKDVTSRLQNFDFISSSTFACPEFPVFWAYFLGPEINEATFFKGDVTMVT